MKAYNLAMLLLKNPGADVFIKICSNDDHFSIGEIDIVDDSEAKTIRKMIYLESIDLIYGE